MKSAVVIIAILLTPSLLLAESLVCGNRIISKGSSSAEMLAFCGEPAQITKSTMYSGATTRSANGAVGVGSEFLVEIWTYNFGPDKLMERVRVENGVVAEIQSMGYGYNEP